MRKGRKVIGSLRTLNLMRKRGRASIHRESQTSCGRERKYRIKRKVTRSSKTLNLVRKKVRVSLQTKKSCIRTKMCAFCLCFTSVSQKWAKRGSCWRHFSPLPTRLLASASPMCYLTCHASLTLQQVSFHPRQHQALTPNPMPLDLLPCSSRQPCSTLHHWL